MSYQKREQPKPPGAFEKPRPLVGTAVKTKDKNDKEMLVFRVSGYRDPFYAFRTEEKILPSGKKSFRATSFHIIQFSENEEPKIVGAVWERDSASRQKQKETEPNLPPDRMRLRIDGDLQNYMAYESPDFIALNAKNEVAARVWKKEKDNGIMLSVSFSEKDKRGFVYPKPGQVAEIFGFENDEKVTVGRAVFDDTGELKTIDYKDAELTIVASPGFFILPTKQRRPKEADKQQQEAVKELRDDNYNVAEELRTKASIPKRKTLAL